MVARHFGRPWTERVPRLVVRQAVAALALVGAIGLVAIGVSGAVAGGMGLVWGKAFVSGDASGVTYTPARCADFKEYFPRAASCEEAAVDHHYEEIVGYRLAAGVGGLFAFAAAAAVQWRRKRRPGATIAGSWGGSEHFTPRGHRGTDSRSVR